MHSDNEPIQPYFLPPGIDWNALPANVRAAMQTIIEPAYYEFVICAEDALERSTGATMVFFLTEEVVNQFALGQGMTAITGVQDDDSRQRAMDRQLRLVASLQRVKSFWVRWRAIRSINPASKQPAMPEANTAAQTD